MLGFSTPTVNSVNYADCEVNGAEKNRSERCPAANR